MSVLKLPLRLLAFTLALALQSHGVWLTAQAPQPWSWGEPESLNSGWTKLEVLVAGRVGEVRTPEEVKVYRRDAGIGTVQVYEIEVQTVIQGAGIRPGDVISVVAIPRTTDVITITKTVIPNLVLTAPGNPPPGWTQAAVMKYHRRTGRFPSGAVLREARSFQQGEERIFALFKPEIRSDYKTIVWSEADSLRRLPNLYGLTLSRPLREDGRDVEVLTRYVEINTVADMDERVRRLAEYSLDLLRDPEPPEEIAKGAVENFGLRFRNPSWGVRTATPCHEAGPREACQPGDRLVQVPRVRHTAEYLDEEETTELVALALNPETPLFLREALIWEFASLERNAQWKPDRFDPTDFLTLLKDRTQNYDLRRASFSLLEEIGGAEVKQAFQEMLHQALSDAGEDQNLLSSIRLSYLLRDDP